MKPLRVAVLGAGLSGLTAARQAQRAGHSVRVFEAGQRAGGVARTVSREGWLIEQGPNTLQETAAVAALIRELGLTEQRVTASPGARNRFVVRGGRLRPLPLSPPRFLGGSFFSARTKLRILRERWTGRRPNPSSDPTFTALICEHFGSEVLDYVAQPFVSGTYAGDPARLSARYAFPQLWQSAVQSGSLLKGQMAAAKARKAAGQPAAAPLISFRSGMGVLPAALKASLAPDTIIFGTAVQGLRQVGSAWQVAGHEFDQVIVTLPAPAVSTLTIERGTGYVQPFAFLGEIAHPPITALFAGFRTEAIKHRLNGFGCLVPAVENRNILGILFSSSLFPNRAPEGFSALTVMMGGGLQPSHARQTALEAWALARPDVESLLGITDHPVFLEATHYAQSIPQYDVGYGKVLEQIEAAEQAFPGLSLRGSYRGGISVPDRLDHCFCASLPMTLSETES